MSGALEKFGIYDFMGIWGPGAITVTYFWFTLGETIQVIFEFFSIEIPIQDELHKLVILYSAVAYVIGVILHELGKVIAERTKLFDATAVQNCSLCKMSHHGFGGKVREEYKDIVLSAIPYNIYIGMNFHEELNKLKYNSISTKRIDTYHSVYGMARSLSLCFVIHAIVILIVCLFGDGDTIALKANISLMLIDIILSVFFLNRAYRYFCSWIRNVFLQAHTIKIGK